MGTTGGCCGSGGQEPGAGENRAATGEIAERVKEKYARAALRVVAGKAASCCGDSTSRGADNPITGALYASEEVSGLPAEAAAASLGCGNPVALARLEPGDVVLDLGSGGGIDVLLSARRVGPTGKVYGLDMTDEMLALARENQAKAGVGNVEFLKGRIEEIPLPDASVDVIISNCVINLSADKRRVIAEAFRVLRPGGRFAVHDIVSKGTVPALVRRSVEAWTGCVAGALDEEEYRRLLAEAGFADVAVEPTRIYRAEDARRFFEADAALADALGREGRTLDALLAEADGVYRSAFVRAVKPRGPAGPVDIRAAVPGDLPEMLALLVRVGLPADGVAEHVRHFLVARAAGELVGSAGLEPYGPAVLLRSVAVAPGHRKRGLGLALTHQLLGRARAEGASRVFLLTETAEAFFAGVGFRRVAREEADPAVRRSAQFQGGCCQSAVCMRLDL